MLILTVVVVERLRVNRSKKSVSFCSPQLLQKYVVFFSIFYNSHLSFFNIHIYMCTCTRSEYLILLVGVVILDIEVTNITLGNVI